MTREANATRIILQRLLGIHPQSATLASPRDEISELIDEVRNFNEFAPQRLRTRPLKRMVGHIGQILMQPHAGVQIALEFRDDPEGVSGFSRVSFQPIASADADLVALGVACYLLRSYALVFCRPKSQRTIDCAKSALNDVHQAYQLAWRLYHSLPCEHHRNMGLGLAKYTLEVRRTSNDTNRAPARSPYWVWSMFLLCEIMRGTIYHQIDYTDEAERHYRRAFHRFDQVWGRVKPEKQVTLNGLTHTLIRALFERSKLQFDQGLLIDSLANQAKCLDYLLVFCMVRERWKGPQLAQAGALRLILHRVVTSLEAERTLPVCERNWITWHFGDPVAAEEMKRFDSACRLLVGANGEPNSGINHLQQYAELLSDRNSAKLAIEVFARIGFTLHTMRSRPRVWRVWKNEEALAFQEHEASHAGWLRAYFQFHKYLRGPGLRQSHLAAYCETLFAGGKPNPHAIADQIGRQYSLHLRKWVDFIASENGEQRSGTALEETRFYEEITRATTQNIANIVTIPRRNWRVLMRRGYRYRRLHGDLRSRSVLEGVNIRLDRQTMSPDEEQSDPSLRQVLNGMNKFVVLKRWQSFNPIIPRPTGTRLRGGGYFLMWHGKGLAIDPGYDFIQNLYEQGFSLEDLFAVVVTHSHPDHDDDFASLTTLVHEWNSFHEKMCRPKMVKKLDLYLSESVHWKFASWLQASGIEFGRIVTLTLTCWDKKTGDPSQGPFRGDNIQIDLRGPDGYDMVIEVVPAWHDDIIDRTSAVGLKFYLYTDGKKESVYTVGYTGDTGAYGLSCLGPMGSHAPTGSDGPNGQGGMVAVDQQYRDCDLLVAHLGDVRLREIGTLLRKNEAAEVEPLRRLLETWFEGCATNKFRQKVADFLEFMVALELVDKRALTAPAMSNSPSEAKRVCDVLEDYCAGRPIRAIKIDRLRAAYRQMTDVGSGLAPEFNATVMKSLGAGSADASRWSKNFQDRSAYLLLHFLAVTSQLPWQYPYHLGIFGLFSVLKAMIGAKESSGRVFIVGELPEELSTYRHVVARYLNMLRENISDEYARRVHCFTGDIGLHIQIKVDNREGLDNSWHRQTKIRCTYCNYNNETICARENYHHPAHIVEIPIIRYSDSMIYLCTTKGHDAGDPNCPEYFFNSPFMRVI
jgi:hypothetical protein